MKYTVQTEIKLPVEKTAGLFGNPDNLKHWQSGLISMEHISGTPGRPGAKSRLLYQMGKRKIEMIETITVSNLPHEFSATYEAKGVFNIVKYFFKPSGDNCTLCINENEFEFSGFMKLIGFLMPGAFKKESMKYLSSFRDFAEKQGSL